MTDYHLITGASLTSNKKLIYAVPSHLKNIQLQAIILLNI